MLVPYVDETIPLFSFEQSKLFACAFCETVLETRSIDTDIFDTTNFMILFEKKTYRHFDVISFEMIHYWEL